MDINMAAVAIGIALSLISLVASYYIGRRCRMRAYYRGLAILLHQAIGHYRGTAETIVAANILGQTAINLLKKRPLLDPQNVGEFDPLITVTYKNGEVENIYVSIEGHASLMRYVRSRLNRETWGGASAHIIYADDEPFKLHLVVAVFDNLDAELVEKLRHLTSIY